MICAVTQDLLKHEAKVERDTLENEAALENVADINEFLQEIFKAVNGVLAKHPAMAKLVDEVALRDEIEINLLQGRLDAEIADRLSEFDWIKFDDVADYDKGAV